MVKFRTNSIHLLQIAPDFFDSLNETLINLWQVLFHRKIVNYTQICKFIKHAEKSFQMNLHAEPSISISFGLLLYGISNH